MEDIIKSHNFRGNNLRCSGCGCNTQEIIDNPNCVSKPLPELSECCGAKIEKRYFKLHGGSHYVDCCLKCRLGCNPQKEKELFVSHGDITHGTEECKTCEDCIKCTERFEQAKKDGTLDKLLSTPSSNEWETEFENKLSHLNWKTCNCCQRAMEFKKDIKLLISSVRSHAYKEGEEKGMKMIEVSELDRIQANAIAEGKKQMREEVVKMIETTKDTFPEVESDEYDNGARRFKRDLLTNLTSNE